MTARAGPVGLCLHHWSPPAESFPAGHGDELDPKPPSAQYSAPDNKTAERACTCEGG